MLKAHKKYKQNTFLLSSEKKWSLSIPSYGCLLGVVTLMTGCASSGPSSSQSFQPVDHALQQAVESGKAEREQAINTALLPPLVLADPSQSHHQVDEPRFDLAVSNAPAAQVFMALVSDTRFSMLVAPEVTGQISVNLKNVTVFEALETLRELYGYEFKVDGTRIYIQPNTLQTRIFQINYLAGKRQGQSEIRVTSSSFSSMNGNTSSGTTSSSGSTTTGGSTSTQNPSSQISTTQDSNFWSDLTVALQSIVGNEQGRAVVINQASGVVLVKAFPSDLRAVERYLKMTQAIVERQVMLEAKILEVTLSEDFQSGVNWAAFGGSQHRYSVGSVSSGTSLTTTGSLSSGDVTVTPGTSGSVDATASSSLGLFGLAFQTANFAALLNFLETQGNVQVLSSPRIATINNQKAVLKVGTDDFYVTNVSSSVTSTGTSSVTTPTITLQPFFSGIALDVTPQIDEDNNVVLHVHPSISNVSENQKNIDLGSLGTYTLPLASSSVNESDSIVRVQDGHIVAIGGLMKQEQGAGSSGLPGSGRSGLGWLLGSKSRYTNKSELVILIKPTIIHEPGSWKEDLLETQSRVRALASGSVRKVPAQQPTN